jgi:hypothetical protein
MLGQDAQHLSPWAGLYLDTVSRVTRGMDETRREWRTSPDRLVETVVGWRTVVISVRCDCYDPDYNADDLLDDLLTSLKLTRIRQRFADVGLAVNAVGEVRPLDVVQDGRLVSSASVDLRVDWQKETSDKETIPPWIERVEAEWVDPE